MIGWTAKDEAAPARHAAAFAAIAFAAIPLAMVIANRSAPAVAGVALLAAATALVLDRRPCSAPQPFSWTAWALIAVSAALLAWPRAVPFAYGEALVCIAIGTGAALLVPPAVPRQALPVLAIGTAVACLAALADLESGQRLRIALGVRPESYIFNRPLVLISLLAWPIVHGLLRRANKTGVTAIAAAGALPALVILTALRSDSGAAVFGIAAGIGAAALTLALPRIGHWLMLAGFLGGVALAPVMGDMAYRAIPERMHNAMASSHTRDRVIIWQDFGAVVRLAPLIGQGLGTSARMADMPAARQVPADRRGLLGVGHPHNAVLQVWVELGALGALALAALGTAALMVIGRTPRAGRALRYGAFATIYSIGLVAHGAWQGWWLVAIGLCVAAFRIADRMPIGDRK